MPERWTSVPWRSGAPTALALVVLVAVAVGLWFTAPGSGDRLLTVVVSASFGLGLVGRHGEGNASRLPPAMQGVVVGAAVMTAVSVVVLGELTAWGTLFGVLALPALHPAVLPPSWRGATTTWTELRRSVERQHTDARPLDR